MMALQIRLVFFFGVQRLGDWGTLYVNRHYNSCPVNADGMKWIKPHAKRWTVLNMPLSSFLFVVGVGGYAELICYWMIQIPLLHILSFLKIFLEGYHSFILKAFHSSVT